MIVEEGGWGGLSDDYYASLTPRGVQYGFFFQTATSTSVTVKGSHMAFERRTNAQKEMELQWIKTQL